jgi:hypothetical protein
MNTPSFRKHCTERQWKSGHQKPSSRRTNIGKCGDAAESTVHAEKNDTHVGQHAANDDKIVEMRTRHFNVSLIPEFYVHNEETDSEYNSQHRTTRQNDIDCNIDLCMFNDSQRTVFRWFTSQLVRWNYASVIYSTIERREKQTHFNGSPRSKSRWEFNELYSPILTSFPFWNWFSKKLAFLSLS